MNDYKTSLEYREYNLDEEFPMLVLSPSRMEAGSTDTARKYHFHNCIEIGICHSGTHVLSYENKDYSFSDGMFFILSPYSMHFVNPCGSGAAESCCEYLYIRPEILLKCFFPSGIPARMLWYMNSETPFIFSAEDEPYIYRLLSIMTSEWKTAHNNYQTVIKGLLLSLMTELADKVPASEEYGGLQELSSGTCRNRSIRLQLQRACELLYSTELSILNISIEAGFRSLSAFYRSFKEQYNMSPQSWRNRKRTIRKKNVTYSPFK